MTDHEKPFETLEQREAVRHAEELAGLLSRSRLDSYYIEPMSTDELPVFWTEAETGDQVDYVPLPLDPEDPYRVPRYREIRRARAKIGEYTDSKDLPGISR